MYTIKQAAIRTGVNVPLLRAWERRYGIPTPGRTESGYRLYDDHAIARVKRMRSLVDAGWAPSQAARSVLEGTPEEAPTGVETSGWTSGVEDRDGGAPTDARTGATPTAELAWLNLRFLGAARALDDAGMESALVEGLALLGVDEALQQFLMPALVDIGASWARGELTVAAEHAASSAAMRRLAALYEAAGTPSGVVDCVVGLPPGSRHEAGALAFAVACRRAGLRVLYLGADVPVASWLDVAREHPEAAIALGAVTASEADSAAQVVDALKSEQLEGLVVVGGADRARATTGREGVLLLPDGLRAGAAMLASRLAER